MRKGGVPLYPKVHGSRFLGNVGKHLPDCAAPHEKAEIFRVAVVRTANLLEYNYKSSTTLWQFSLDCESEGAQTLPS
jgi:hypothetical protein